MSELGERIARRVDQLTSSEKAELLAEAVDRIFASFEDYLQDLKAGDTSACLNGNDEMFVLITKLLHTQLTLILKEKWVAKQAA
jgi:hypothetical protein